LHANDGVNCRGNPQNAAIDAGVNWLAKNFDKVASNVRYPRDFPFITLYAVERVGVAGGLKYFGEHDWYDKGAKWLLQVQLDDGSFDVEGQTFGPIVDTS